MKHILIGYGYTARFVADELSHTGELIEAYARQPHLAIHPNLRFIQRDIGNEAIEVQTKPYYLYYFISPPNIGTQDTLLRSFIQNNDLRLCKAITYISSSGVYGDHQGAWVDEKSDCTITTDRQRRRLDSEKQILSLSQKYSFPALILRCAGIYGPKRIPIDAAKSQQPIILPDQAPATNLIYVKDLAKIIVTMGTLKLTGTYNIADGNPSAMGHLQKLVAEKLGYPPAPLLPYERIYNDASDMKRFFMQNSKRLKVDKLRSHLSDNLNLTPISDALGQILRKEGDT